MYACRRHILKTPTEEKGSLKMKFEKKTSYTFGSDNYILHVNSTKKKFLKYKRARNMNICVFFVSFRYGLESFLKFRAIKIFSLCIRLR